MKVMCTSDFHMSWEKAKKAIDEAVNRDVDIFVNTGDFLSNDFANRVAQELCNAGLKGLFVEGNWDHNITLDMQEDVRLLKYQHVKISRYYFFGMDEKIYYDWEDMLSFTSSISSNKLIFLTHEPPKGFLDKIWNGTHIGNVDYAEFIKRKKPLLHCFGHVHEGNGFKKVFENTLLVNAAVADIPKSYVVDLKNLEIETVELR